METLYLARGGKQDIYVKSPKQQNVIQGIRFLYRQFIKKKPGLILNDPYSQSRRIQTVLFVSAIRSVLERPVLILCSEGDKNKWRECFETWTNMADDITTDTTNPFAKKVSVYISPIHEVKKFHSREWNGVIIDSDIIHKEVLKININTKFKVWITGVDVKKDLTVFSQLYKWLYPKERFDPNMFNYNKNDPNDVVAKAILLDSFMEDIVLRRDDFENTIPKPPETPKVTKKNKDATGTKIKRTKKNTISSSQDDSPTKPSKTNKTSSNDNNFTSNSSKYAEAAVDRSRSSIGDTRTTIHNSRATLDDFKVTLDILSSTTVDSSKIRIEYYNEDQTSDQIDENNEISEKAPIICDEEDNSMDLLLKYEIDEKSTPVFKKSNGDQTLENNEISEKAPIICDEEDNSMDLLLKYEIDEKSTPVFKKSNGDQKQDPDASYSDVKPESNDSAYMNDTQENYDEIVNFKDAGSCYNHIKDDTKSNDDKNSTHLVSNEITEITTNDKIIINTNKIDGKIDLKSKEEKESEDLFSTESLNNLKKVTEQNVTSKQQITSNLNSVDLFSTESMSTLNKIANQNEIVNKDNVKNHETDPNSLDARIKQMEEIAMKKFKGSFLDSIF